MKNLITRFNNITTTAVITLWCCLAQADDIEVYRGGAVGGSPVALLVLDTSGSMGEEELVDTPDYDPNIIYKETYKENPSGDAIDYQFDTDLYYFSDSYTDQYLFRDDIDDLLTRPFPANALACQGAAAIIPKEGKIQSFFKRWNTAENKWEPAIGDTSSDPGGSSSYFNDKFGLINSFDELFKQFKNFNKFSKAFKDFLQDFKNDFTGGDVYDEFSSTFGSSYFFLERFWFIWGFDDFEDVFNGDFEKFKTFFNQAVSTGKGGGKGGNGSGGTTAIVIPTGDPSDLNAIIECKSDEGVHPSGQYINTNTNNTTQYESAKVEGYENSWSKHYFKYIYHGNYLNYKIYANYYEDERYQTRMQITVDAAKHMVNTTDGIKLGLARFNRYGDGGRIDIAVDDVASIRTAFNNKLDSYIPPAGGTPLEESYYEAVRYLRGDAILNGTGSSLLSRDGNTYISPITNACQNVSNIVLFTDGEPTGDDDVNNYIRSLINHPVTGVDFSDTELFTAEDRKVLSNSCSGNGQCAEELAYYLANRDQLPDLPGIQTIRTHTIGGFFDDTGDNPVLKYMEDIAKYGQGTYAAASSKEKIIESFKAAVTVTMDDPVTFVAPSVAANSYNSLEHLDQLYYAMFVPSADNNWNGNLKSYRLSPDGIVVDAKGNPAIDPSSGLFKPTSRSYWTDPGVTDGDDVSLGGAAANLTKEFNIFTHLSTAKGPLSQRLTTASISKGMVGLSATASDTEHAAVIDWLNRKVDANNTRRQMEDPLHSRPLVVNYGYSQDETTKRITSDGVVFVGTNSGYLHAFKADKENFQEYFSFIPKELLSNGNLYRTKDDSPQKTYGVDGPMNYWHVDANQNLQVDDGEKVYLFFGLRRGGRHYYALDITDRNAPKFQWQISGGQGGAFDKMGQSWSPMTLAKVKWGASGKTKVVLLFGGGYDTAEDGRNNRVAGNVGNAVYMIDPETGELLWSASNADATTKLTDMTSSITSQVKTVDFDGDQITDYFFVSDLGGRIWRFDLNDKDESITKSNFIAGAGMIFDANAGSTNYQRFYDAPSVSYFSNPNTKEKFLTLSIGSGYRASPLKIGDRDTKDSFYVVKDYDITTLPTEYKAPLRSTFKDITEAPQVLKRDEVKVWKYDLTDGEKILSTPLTSNGNMYFTTFTPTGTAASSNTCNAEIGSSRVYYVDFMGDDGSGSPTDPTNPAGPSSPMITSNAISSIGIPPPVIELNTTDTGQEMFCEEFPNHASCQPKACEEDNSCPDKCESTGSVIISGTHVLDGGTLRCDLLKKDYWRSL